MDLQLGYVDDNRDEATRRAGYLRGSGADTLVFGYTVRPGDMDTKGVRIPLGIVLGSEQSSFGGSGTIQGRGNGCREAPILSWRRSPAGSQGGY
ncbi:MAG: hypothetical protein F4Z35_06470 [Dehalococcoidia bacterium]|nr:hypothetical protein [Dehalococcoidia bacterium]